MNRARKNNHKKSYKSTHIRRKKSQKLQKGLSKITCTVVQKSIKKSMKIKMHLFKVVLHQWIREIICQRYCTINIFFLVYRATVCRLF